jgi:hypothetical protein
VIWDVAITLTEYLTHHPELVVRKKVLDLGTGVGQLSIAAALLGCVDVVASDVQELEGLVERNVTLASQHLSGMDKKRVLNIQCVRGRSERASEASAKKAYYRKAGSLSERNQGVASCGRSRLAQRAQRSVLSRGRSRLAQPTKKCPLAAEAGSLSERNQGV